MIEEKNGVSYLDYCELCGDPGRFPYYEGHGFFCERCADELEAGQEVGFYRPLSVNNRKIIDESSD